MFHGPSPSGVGGPGWAMAAAEAPIANAATAVIRIEVTEACIAMAPSGLARYGAKDTPNGGRGRSRCLKPDDRGRAGECALFFGRGAAEPETRADASHVPCSPPGS